MSFQVLVNAVWYITNQQSTINEAALRQKNVLPVPAPFDQYTGYNEVKRKKCKSQPLTRTGLNQHAESLYSLLLKPHIRSSPAWSLFGKQIEQLAKCLMAYKEHLDRQVEKETRNRSMDHPVRTVDQHATVEYRQGTPFMVKEKYALLDSCVKQLGMNKPLIFCETEHLNDPFENSSQRFRYLAELQLSVPVDIIRFCPGGSVVTTVCLAQVQPNRTDSEMLTQAARMVQQMRPQLKEYHTRAQKRLFKQKLNNIASIQPAVVDFIYTELALDASQSTHPEMQQRLRLIFMGETGLLADMRHLNPGRPSDTYDVFFENLAALLEEVTAADDRRHGHAHLSEWISLEEMVRKAAARCAEGTPIPSKSLVRLQFAPNNPYTRRALNFTSRLSIQYKIQRRQLRVSHPDDHYCAALLKYLKQKAVELKDHLIFLCCDDKAKVPVGEPGAPVSTGVRGRQSISVASSQLVALDHDMTKASLTPSVVLECAIPDTVEKSFVRGKVTTVVNDSVFQTSSPFRHAAILKSIVEQRLSQDLESPKILFKYTDGGTDQRNTLESVKLACIALFLELKLDMLIAVRCAPGQSFLNPAERIMSILNYGLQNCATERQLLDEPTEVILKRCSSMAAIREQAKKKVELEEKWKESIGPVQSLVRDRFLRLNLKEEPVTCLEPASEQCINSLFEKVKLMFPGLERTKLQKVFTQKIRTYCEWKKKHCVESQYTFQIRKCKDVACCSPANLSEEELTFLPNPMLDVTGEHYKSYEVLKFAETSEDDRPSFQIQKKKPTKNKNLVAGKSTTVSGQADVEVPPVVDPAHTAEVAGPEPSTSGHAPLNSVAECSDEIVEGEVSFSTQHARASAVCIECNKPRVVYSRTKLSQRAQLSLAVALSEFEYTCGSHLFPPTVSPALRRDVAVRDNLQCAMPIELPYYAAELGRKDLCAYCGDPNAETDAELKLKYKTVLPICGSCRAEGETPICQREFGKSKK